MKKYFYVYRITNVIENKHYYGYRSSKTQPHLDLGIKYFSSSSDKKFIKDQKETPKNYKYIIIKECKNKKEALLLEIKLHQKFNVSKNKNFYNLANQTSIGFSTEGVHLTNKRKEEISIFFSGRKQTQDHIQKRSAKIKGEANGMYSTNFLEKWISQVGEEIALIEYQKFLEENRNGKNNPMYGKFGKNHGAAQTYNLTGNGLDELYFCGNDIKQRVEELCINWNTLRQYSAKRKSYKGFILKFVKR